MYKWNLGPQPAASFSERPSNKQGPVTQRTNFMGAASGMDDGTIVLVTPELGRWSTIGGLGVMVNELSIGFAELGHKVVVISPYYEFNRKNETNYLERDPDGIKYTQNIDVEVEGKKVGVGLHEGVVSGVKVVFLHNTGAFSRVYNSNGAKHCVYQCAVFAKACLEYCCVKNIKPSIFVTNDWFTGFCGGYIKAGFYGKHFASTKIMHIIHNLEENYDGCIKSNEDFSNVHGLKREWFSWHNNDVQMSKGAITCCDQWATVSQSYK